MADAVETVLRTEPENGLAGGGARTGADPAEPLAGVTPSSGRRRERRPLEEVIATLGYASGEQLVSAVSAARERGERLERVLVEQGVLTGDELARATAERLGLDHLDLSVYELDMSAAQLVSLDAAKRYTLVPVRRLDDRTLLVAMGDPTNVLAIDDVALQTGMRIKVAVASPDDIDTVLSKFARLESALDATAEASEEEDTASSADLVAEAVDAPVVRLVSSILAQAVEQKASDIHFEANGRGLRVRFRSDGILMDFAAVPAHMAAGVVSRLKIMANVDIAERRLPQDGRVALRFDGRQVDVRLVTLPSVHGESVILRLLDKSAVSMRLDGLGVPDADLGRLVRTLNRSHGAVLITGPTGSGKSTTLYAALALINRPEQNIITIEDPVEYELDGITQLPVNLKAGLTFATGLRSMMRADPDVIMVGEIRDRDTAKIAIEGAMTGHLVLTTLHTNDAPTAITRLIEMGVEPFLVASAVNAVVAQRLVRVLCPACKRPVTLRADVLRGHGFAVEGDVDAFEPVGCARCSGTGFRGRLGLFELMTVSSAVREVTLGHASSDEIGRIAMAEGMRRLADDAIEKIRGGVTSVDEALRVTGGG